MNTLNSKRRWMPYLWLLPSIVLMAVFVVFPIAIVCPSIGSSSPGFEGVFEGVLAFAPFPMAIALPVLAAASGPIAMESAPVAPLLL